MRNIILGTALLAVAGIGAVVTAPTANADPGSPTCATRAEFSQIHKGMTVAQVAREFGINGRQSFYYDGTYIPDEMDRTYRPCTRWSNVEVDFQRPANGGTWTVHSKSGWWI